MRASAIVSSAIASRQIASQAERREMRRAEAPGSTRPLLGAVGVGWGNVLIT